MWDEKVQCPHLLERPGAVYYYLKMCLQIPLGLLDYGGNFPKIVSLGGGYKMGARNAMVYPALYFICD